MRDLSLRAGEFESIRVISPIHTLCHSVGTTRLQYAIFLICFKNVV